jgi:hypothetical protein
MWVRARWFPASGFLRLRNGPLTVHAIWSPTRFSAAALGQQCKTNSAYWRVMDACTSQAQKLYPDYTPESNAKGEKARQAWLRASNLPTAGSSLSTPTPRENSKQ